VTPGDTEPSPGTHPYRAVPPAASAQLDSVWLPSSLWRRLPCIAGVHAWRRVRDGSKPTQDPSGWYLCRRCGATGEEVYTVMRLPGAGGARVRIKGRPYSGPPLRCRACLQLHPAPLLHGCCPAYDVEPVLRDR